MGRSKKEVAPPLTEREWAMVFELRCQSKRGARLRDEDMAFLRRAHGADTARYNALDAEVRQATAPFGAFGADVPSAGES